MFLAARDATLVVLHTAQLGLPLRDADSLTCRW